MSIKTATVTFHASHNYGSMLQAYGLQQTIQKLGYSNEIINLRTERQKKLYGKPSIDASISSLKTFIKNLLLYPYTKVLQKKYDLFEDFLSTKLNTTREYSSMEELKAENFDYDCYISGGDQIWNTAPIDFDWSFYLPFVKNGKRISYAVSMGPVAEDAITSRDTIKTYLSYYRHISVREEGTKSVVNSLTNKEISMDLDPALLLSSKEWEKLIPKDVTREKDYILLYVPWYTKSVYDMAHYLSKKLGLKVIVSILGSPRSLIYPFKKKLDVGPCEFLGLVKNAKLVVSGSFHALVFSTIFHIPFFAVNGDKDNRMKTFLKNMGLLDRTINDNDKNDKWRQALHCDFSVADHYLDIKRDESIEYLRKAIED